jgi:hypothetical protein
VVVFTIVLALVAVQLWLDWLDGRLERQLVAREWPTQNVSGGVTLSASTRCEFRLFHYHVNLAPADNNRVPPIPESSLTSQNQPTTSERFLSAYSAAPQGLRTPLTSVDEIKATFAGVELDFYDQLGSLLFKLELPLNEFVTVFPRGAPKSYLNASGRRPCDRHAYAQARSLDVKASPIEPP